MLLSTFKEIMCYSQEAFYRISTMKTLNYYTEAWGWYFK